MFDDSSLIGCASISAVVVKYSFLLLSIASYSYILLSSELEKLRKRRAEYDKQDSLKEALRRRVNESIEVINSRQELLEEFDDNLFNALVERIEVISPTHFIFVLKSGMRVEEKYSK